MFFTAIALIAFTGASMSNTEEVKEAVVVEKTHTTEPQTEEVLRSRCDAIWLKAFLDYGGSKNYDQAIFYADLATDAAGGCDSAW